MMNYYELSTYKEELQKIIESNTSISKLKGKSIVITGARGLIGSVITDAILQANLTLNLDCKVYAVVRNVEKAKERFLQYKSLKQFQLIPADINKDEIKINNNIDYFIHGASNTHPVYYASRPIETIRTNT
ncbi:MAG: NAD-dependent epimerase/dehydratase family protein, partial [Selenomonadaceae bacterium]|nr:NAD-dependent epimerase/dehydratase family protein [Selenomonadaceae bacterium]